VFCPDSGWVDFDPANAQMPATEHAIPARWRDFAGISPLRGLISNDSEYEQEIAVTVIPESKRTLFDTPTSGANLVQNAKIIDIS